MCRLLRSGSSATRRGRITASTSSGLNAEGFVLPLTENLRVPVNASANACGHGECSVGNPVVDRPLGDRQKLGCGFFGDEFVRGVHR